LLIEVFFSEILAVGATVVDTILALRWLFKLYLAGNIFDRFTFVEICGAEIGMGLGDWALVVEGVTASCLF
jgi:hypothetical protein